MIKLRAAQVAVAAVATAVGVLGIVSPAQAAGPYWWQDVATGFCLDSNTSGNAYTLGCNGGNFQNWIWTGSSSSVEHRNVATGFCLDSNTSGKVYTLGCNGGNFQRWTRSGQRWINVATGRCLDSNTSGSLYTLPCNGGTFQKWQ